MTGESVNGLMTVASAAELIRRGVAMTVAGDASLLAQLPPGQWIGGTTPYFMTPAGGECRRDQVFVQCLDTSDVTITSYDRHTLNNVLEDAPENGYSIIVLPAGSSVLEVYAHHAPDFPEMFIKPIVGWVSGVHLDDLGRESAAVFDGIRSEPQADRAVVMHVRLPEGLSAIAHTVNLFEAGDGPELMFHETSDMVEACLIDGSPGTLAEAVQAHAGDRKLPLVANYCGAMVNVSIQAIDEQTGTVTLYAPVFAGVGYRFAKPVEDYPAAFLAAMPDSSGELVFGCNCILNYLHSELNGKKTADLTGPITFGEVAYQLMNQTAVFLTVERDDQA